MNGVIIHVVNTFFAVQYFVGNQFKYFKNRGYEVHLICPPSPFIEAYKTEMDFIYKQVAITRRYSPIYDFVALLKICCYLIKIKPDIIVGHTPKGGLLAMLSGKLTGVKKRIYFRHGLVFETAKGISRRILILTERLNASLATSVVCVSKSVFNASLKHRLNSESKQLILGMGTCGGIDASGKFNPDFIDKGVVKALKSKLGVSETDYVVGFCGRLVRDKGIIDLIGAYDLIRFSTKTRVVKLLLVGMFEDRDSLPTEIKNRIVNDNSIIYTGFINTRIEDYYAIMDVFVLPTYREGFGMSVIEASSMRLPVLTTRATGSIDSIIEDTTGRFVDNNPHSIAEGISYYMQNEEIAIAHGLNGRNYVVDNYDHPIIWREIEKLYC